MRESEAARGRERGAWQSGQAPRRSEPRVCLWCDVSLDGRRRRARWCSTRCRTYWARQQRRIEVIRLRPRCMICDNPMPYRDRWQGPGVNLTANTCSDACKQLRYRWFVQEAA